MIPIKCIILYDSYTIESPYYGPCETFVSYTEVFMLSAVMMLVAAILAALISCISNKESKALMSSSDDEQSTEELET